MKKYVGLSAALLCFSFVAFAGDQTVKKSPVAINLGGAVTGGSQCDADVNNLVTNCGFETGVFLPDWTRSGDPSFTGIDGGSRYSGSFGLDTGPTGTLGFITQQVPTDPSALYDLSFWLRNAQTPNQFQVIWNGVVIYDQTNMPDFPYTSSDLLPVGDPTVFIGLVPSDGDTTELTFGFFNVPDYFWLDDVDLVQE